MEIRIELLLSDFEQKYKNDKSIMKINSSPECRCDFKPRDYHGNSTPRDLVITGGFGKLTNIYAFVRSLRTTHCKATIVIISDFDPILDLENCGVVFIKVSAIGGIKNKKRMRWSFLSDFLDILDPKDYDRIIYADLYDSVFMSDPFTDQFTANDFLISDEDELISKAYFFRQISHGEFFGFNFSNLMKCSVLCSGVFGIGFENGKLLLNLWQIFCQIIIPIDIPSKTSIIMILCYIPRNFKN